jgi:hypothetical protein
MSKDWRSGLQARLKELQTDLAAVADTAAVVDEVVGDLTNVNGEGIGTLHATGLLGVAGTGVFVLAADGVEGVEAAAGESAAISGGNATAGTDPGAADGGDVSLVAGIAARNSSGNARGGDVILQPGTGIGTGRSGLVFANLPTADPQVAGALWEDAGTVKVSAGPA